MKHGTSTSYLVHKCRCDVCRSAQSRRQKEYRLDRLRGVQRLVDAQPLRDHVANLYESGMSQWDVTISAGWKSRNAIADVLRRDKVTPRTMNRVLAVTAPPVSRRNGYVDATGSRRRLQALAVMGWSTRTIATRIGNLDPGTYQYIANGSTGTIRRRTAQAIADLYDELWDKPGPSRQAASIARKRGYLPPLAWDDDAIDNPAATPYVEQLQPRRIHTVIENWHDTWDHHLGDVEIAAARLRISVRRLTGYLTTAQREGIPVRRRDTAA